MDVNYHVSFSTHKSAQEAFDAINSVPLWWTQNLDGKFQNEGDEFWVQFGDVHYSKHKLIEVITNARVVWLTTESRINFVSDKNEWTGMQLVFEIAPEASGTRVSFTQIGLNPDVECYDACSNAWDGYILGSLRNLIETGAGNPDKRAVTA